MGGGNPTLKGTRDKEEEKKIFIVCISKNKNPKPRRQWIHPIIRLRYLFDKLTTDKKV